MPDADVIAAMLLHEPPEATPEVVLAAPKRRGPGRPPAEDGKTARMQTRVRPTDLAAWANAAEAAGLSLNAWVERVCNAATSTERRP